MNWQFHLLPCIQMGVDEDRRTIPKPTDHPNEKLLFLRENMFHLTSQLSMPIIEVALVVSKYIRIVYDSLEKVAENSGEKLPADLLHPIPIDDLKADSSDSIHSFPLESLIGSVDEDRMDILDTLIRNVLNESELEFILALQELRDWEYEIRLQLSKVSGPGGLFSPISLSDGF